MMLKNENAVLDGAGCAIGSTVARAFAREGANVFLPGRNLASVSATAKEIVATGGTAQAAQVDALDEAAADDRISEVVKKAGMVDISCNAITPIPQLGTQGIPIAQLSVESFRAPTTAYMRSYFLTARSPRGVWSRIGQA
jgi:NAD(P)-dependent dehydrogenase (short-subunit alcohol dehydrogenase family)